MRKLILAIGSAAVLGLCVYLQAETPKKDADTAEIRIQLQDADTGKPIGGIVRVFRDDKPLQLSELYDRLRGLKPTATLAGWHVVPASGGSTSLPCAQGATRSRFRAGVAARERGVRPDPAARANHAQVEVRSFVPSNTNWSPAIRTCT